MICALIQNDTVVGIQDLTVDQIQSMSASYGLIIDVTNLNPQPAVGWVLNGNTLVPGSGQTAAPSMIITSLAFSNRLTQSESIAFYTGVAANNPTFLYLQSKLQLASYVDLNRADTIQLTQTLVALGVLTQARANTILTAPPTATEIYKGKV